MQNLDNVVDMEIPTKCPLCKSNLKKSKVKKDKENIMQVVKCKKNWWFGKCKFKQKYTFRI